MAFPRVFDAHKVVVGMAYLAAYALLDWISFIEPYAHLGITPWNPGTGLSFVLLLLFGRRMIPFLFVASAARRSCPSAIRPALDVRDRCPRCWSAAATRSPCCF